MIIAALRRLAPAVALVALASGCASTPDTADGRALDGVLLAYDAGRYDEAYEEALDLAARTQRGERDAARYLAGLSAHRAGRLDDAALQLELAANSSDRGTRAKATAELGLVRLEQDRPAEAARCFTAAAEDLPATDRRQAETFARLARTEALADDGASSGLDDHGRWTAVRPTSGEGFALQVGAFTERSRATKAADEARDLANRAHLGAVRLKSRVDERGRTLYVVQVGAFPTRSAAQRARDEVGRLDYLIAPALP